MLALPGGAVDGARLLGENVPAVEAALGTPSSVETLPNRRDLTYRGRLEVVFAGPSSDPAAQTAWALLVLDPDATVPGLGRPLARTPRTLGANLRALGLQEQRPYRCDRRGCFGTFLGAAGSRLVVYGLLHGRRYLGVQLYPKPAR